MAEHSGNYTIADLARITGLSARTIRYYITFGLLPSAHGRGPAATYDQRHLLRLQLVERLKTQHLPLEEIRSRLAELTDRQIGAMVQVERQPAGDRWRRVRLHRDIELHFREAGEGVPASIEDTIALIVEVVTPVVERLESSK